MKRDNRLNASTWNRIEQSRREFGVLLRRLRLERGMSCEGLALKTGKTSRTAVATIERGQRQAGAQVSERLADALELDGEQRQNFLVAGLRTTVREMLPAKSKGLDPELFQPMWQLLMNNGIRSNEGHRIRLENKLSSNSPEPLKQAAHQLAEKAARLSARIHEALATPDNPFHVNIEVETQDGTILLVELLAASSKIPTLPPAKRQSTKA